MFRQVLLARSAGSVRTDVEEALTSSINQRLVEADLSQGSELATLLSLPGLAELEALQSPVDPPALFQAALDLRAALGVRLEQPMQALLQRCQAGWDQSWPEGQGERQLTAVAWSWLVAAGHQEARRQALEAVSGSSMTLARAALRALHPIACQEREEASAVFFDRWQDWPVFDHGCPGSVDAQIGWPGEGASADAASSFRSARSQFTAGGSWWLCSQCAGLHAAGGHGYRFMAEQIARWTSAIRSLPLEWPRCSAVGAVMARNGSRRWAQRSRHWRPLNSQRTPVKW